MMLCIGEVLRSAEVADLTRMIGELEFADGRKTAGWAARLVKKNEQAIAGAKLDAVRQIIARGLEQNEVFQLAARPKQVTPTMISRYSGGEEYGAHVDDALMRGMRSDLSFTLFLADPASYDGGDLVIDQSLGEQSFKLNPGSLILYPSNTLHRVEPVTRGTRIAAIGWVRSFIRSNEQRELLFDLETARRSVFQQEGKSPVFDLLSKSSANLLRMWAED